jgi:hypothetical protein
MNPDQSGNSIQTEQTGQSHRQSRRGVLIAGGGIAAVAVLGGAACVGSQMLNRPQLRTGDGGGQLILQGGPPGSGAQMREFKMPKIKLAPELPADEPDLAGLFLRRQDNSVFIGTGNIEMMVQRDASGETAAKASHSGPDVEVIITRDTRLYEDKTPITLKDMEEQREVQQVIAPVASLDDLVGKLNDTDSLMVWGQKSGDRYVAKTIVYRPPVLPSNWSPG